MKFVLWAASIIAILAGISVPLRIASGPPITPTALQAMRTFLLWIAGIVSSLMTLIVLAAAAWGMDTRLPWGLGIYSYLLPALSLPAFLLLLTCRVQVLANIFWLLTAIFPFAWYFGDRAERIATHLPPLTDPHEIFGTFLNAFTILFVAISILVQLAAVCDTWAARGLESSTLSSDGAASPPS
jgi:hypothetical protein